MIAIGAFSPLTGFVGEKDFISICENTRLADGTVWPIPITLAVEDDVKNELAVGGRAALKHADGTLLAVIDIEEIYAHDKKLEIPAVFRTEDEAHPGVKQVMDEGDWCVAGPIHVITVTPEREPGEQFTEHRLPPAETRGVRRARAGTRVAAFQTRNPIHRAHEYLCKVAQELCDGLLIHPLVGETKPGDIPADVRMECYQVLIKDYFVEERTMLTVMPAAMRYAGPKEAILHALVRKNYGVSHFIVGRDHAGRGRLLRQLRRPDDLRRVRAGGDWADPAEVRARGVEQSRPGHGEQQDVPDDQGRPRVPVGHEGARAAGRGRASPGGVHPARGGRRADQVGDERRAGERVMLSPEAFNPEIVNGFVRSTIHHG
jgi:ATP sulfurylase